MFKKSPTLFILVTLFFGLTTLSIQALLADGDPLSSFNTSHFSGSRNCATCHTSLPGGAGTDVSFDTQWRATMMANASKDPLWQAKVESEVLRNPAQQAEIEATCTRCHMPMAHEQATSDSSAITMFGDGFLNPANPLHEAAMDGISCSLCHQITANGLGDPSTYNGQFDIDTSTVWPDRLAFGKYNPVMGSIMQSSVGFLPIQSLHMTESGLCGTCHMLTTSPVDGDGNPLLIDFPEQMTYLEWTQSDFGDGIGLDTTCGDCHMPMAVGDVPLTIIPGNAPSRPDFRQHTFVGSNAFMLTMLRDNGVDLGVTASTEQFNTVIGLTEEKMGQETAVLSFTSIQTQTDQIAIDVQIDSLTGHKLPTGIPLRRAWVHLKVTDGNGQVLFESGASMADGQITGNDADEDPDSFEPHYDLITDGDQVQVYEAIMENSDGEVTYTLLRAVTYAKDNRLLPGGFDKAGAPTETAVYGNAATDTNFISGGDQIRYEIALPADIHQVTVTAELLFQAVSYPVADDLSQHNTTIIDRFTGYYATADHTPVQIAAQSETAIINPIEDWYIYLPTILIP